MKNTVLYSLVAMSVFGFAGVASAHYGEGNHGWGIGFNQELRLEKRAELSERMKEWKESRLDAKNDFEAFVGLSFGEIREEKRDGKTMEEILEDQGKNREDTEEFFEAQADAHVDAVVDAHDLSAKQETKLRVRVAAFIDRVLDRWFGDH